MERRYKKIHINVIAFIIMLLVNSCGKDVKINYTKTGIDYNPMLHKAEEIPDLEINNFHDRCSQDGKLVWTLKAEEAKIYTKFKRINLLSPVLFYFNKDGTTAAYVVSERGAVASETQDVSLFGNVVVKTRTDSILKTEELHWCNSIKKIFTDKYVYIKKKNGDVITGYGMTADIDLNKIILKKASMKGRFDDFKY